MNTVTLSIILIVAAVVIGAVIVVLISGRRRSSKNLREKYGSEYDLTMEKSGNRKAGEKALGSQARRTDRPPRALSPSPAAGADRRGDPSHPFALRKLSRTPAQGTPARRSGAHLASGGGTPPDGCGGDRASGARPALRLLWPDHTGTHTSRSATACAGPAVVGGDELPQRALP